MTLGDRQPSPNRRHDRMAFFKYMTAPTAHIILDSGNQRWSSPVLFNDPFDVPREADLGFTSVMMDGSLGEDGKTPNSYEQNVAITKALLISASITATSTRCTAGARHGNGSC